jgi:hypothetical protein
VSQETSQKRVLENQESFAHVSSHCEAQPKRRRSGARKDNVVDVTRKR